jgi:hypothetical protein
VGGVEPGTFAEEAAPKIIEAILLRLDSPNERLRNDTAGMPGGTKGLDT